MRRGGGLDLHNLLWEVEKWEVVGEEDGERGVAEV